MFVQIISRLPVENSLSQEDEIFIQLWSTQNIGIIIYKSFPSKDDIYFNKAVCCSKSGHLSFLLNQRSGATAVV